MLKPLVIKQGEVTYVTEEFTKIGRGEGQLLACRLFSSRDWGARGTLGEKDREDTETVGGRGTQRGGENDAFPSFLHGQEE